MRKDKTIKKFDFQKYKKKSNRQKLGAIIDDAVFLEKLSKNLEFGKEVYDSLTEEYVEDKFGKLIKNHADEAVSFFDKKANFWDQCSKMKPMEYSKR